MPKIVVGMSGGVDSAIAAYLLRQEGYDVIGVMLCTHAGEERCGEIEDARNAAQAIGIPFHVVDCADTFNEKVIRPFICDYLHGLTPNPCVICNRAVKWDCLCAGAKELGAELVGTGHYASVTQLENGRYTVKKAAFAEKDQTYMLCRLSQEQLAQTRMPLAAYSKQQIRKIAEEIGLSVASKPDSQEICFVTDGDYAEYIRKYADAPIPGEGNYIDEDGNVLGKHRGIIHYTVGQRKRLGIALGRPAYIKKIIPETNEIVLGEAGDVFCRSLDCRDMNWMGIPPLAAGEKLSCKVRVRYRHEGQRAEVEALEDGAVRVNFSEPVRFAAPGQTAVFYDEDECVLGGGFISDVRFGD